ncbi:MAG TPA: aminopeptidase P family protein [Bacteroidales bacterium]|jgi:Xaa-Pro aminopeptidase|nr:aminopeptidase P family protein [Bacteroidales bacterium]
MNPLFSASVYQKRRENLMQIMTSGYALFLGNDEASMNYPSNTYKYRQDSTFLYFFGLSLPNMGAIIDFDHKKTILFGDDFEIDDIIWMGDQPKVKELGELVGITEVLPMADLSKFIQQNSSGKLHFTAPYRGEKKIVLSQLTGIPISDLNTNVSVELIKAIVSLREIKSQEEITEIEDGCAIGYEMFTTAMRHCKVGAKESDLAGMVEGIALSKGNGVSFPVILSQHGETLHNHNHNQILEEGKILLVDMGAENKMNYCSDNTRAIPVSGKFTPKQADIYNIVYQANMQGIAACKPGIRYKEVHQLAVTIITEGLQKLGLMKGDVQKSVELGAHALFMPHGLGHQMGLDVHDMEDLGEKYVGYDETVERSTIFGWAYLRMAKTLKPGHVMTVEPGIYFIPHLIDLWKNENKFTEFINYDKVEEYRNFGGIRIEDDVLITETGHVVLGKPIPKSIQELEAIVGK